MSTSETRGRFEQVPDWCVETVLGLAAASAGVVGMSLGAMAVGWVVGSLSGSGTAFRSVVPYGLALLLLALVNATVGLGVTYAYLAYRKFDPGFVLAWPDRETTRWLAGLVVLAPALVGAGTLLLHVLGRKGINSAWLVPEAALAPQPFTAGLKFVGDPALVSALILAVIAVAVAPAVGALVHGVLQNSLRRAAPTAVAVGGTALAAVVLTGATDVIGTVLAAVVVVAAGYAYERTGNLAVPMVAYMVLNAVTLVTGRLLLMAALGAL